MNKLLTALAIALLGLCSQASVDVIQIGHGDTYTTLSPAKVIGVECFSTVADGTYNPKRETVVMSTEDRVTDFALTNFTYSVVTTNATTGAATTNVLSRPHPIPYPDTMTGYWTNTVVTAWSVTNTVPVLGTSVTNDVEANSFLAPGDTVFCPSTDTFRGKLLIYVEK